MSANPIIKLFVEDTVIQASQPSQVAAVVSDPQTFVTVQSDIPAVVVITQGPQGPSGNEIEIVATAGQNIMAFQVVVNIGGLMYVADPTNSGHITHNVGIATSSALSGSSVNLSLYGEITGFQNNLIAGAQYSVGLNGILSLSNRALGAIWSKVMGVAKSASIFTNIPDSVIEIS